MKDVVVIDYGLGNLHSVVNALTFLGGTVRVAEQGEQIKGATHLVLPGVGAFADGMRGLLERGHVTALHEYVSTGKPLLGICLGAQLLLSESTEFGVTQGLNLIPGRVVSIPSEGVKVPLVGWKALQPTSPDSWKGTFLKETAPGTWAYFIHSYHAVPENKEHLIGVCYYGGHSIHAVVRRENVMGCQFHPEKSGKHGLEMLRSFLNL